MTDREKLIELIRCVQRREQQGCTSAMIADHLIANGVVVREKGEWEDAPYVYFGAKRYVCSRCKDDEFWCERFVVVKEYFCPNCGADMRGGNNER